MKMIMALFPCLVLAAAFIPGCASNKCETSSACCDDKADCCKNGGECKEGACKEGECKDGKQAAPAAAAPAQSMAPVNTICPIGEHDADKAITASFEGKTIAFCCEDCKVEFAGMNDQGKAEVLAKATSK